MLWGFKCYYTSSLIICSHSYHAHSFNHRTLFHTHTRTHIWRHTRAHTHTHTHTILSRTLHSLSSIVKHAYTHTRTFTHASPLHLPCPSTDTFTHSPWCTLASKLFRINFNYIRAMRESIWRPWKERWHSLRGEEKDWKRDRLGERCLFVHHWDVHIWQHVQTIFYSTYSSLQ